MPVVAEPAVVVLAVRATVIAVEGSMLSCNEFTAILFVDGVWTDGTI